MLALPLKTSSPVYLVLLALASVVATAPFPKVGFLMALPLHGFADVPVQYVHYERGAESLAAEIAILYPETTSRIEGSFGTSFNHGPQVYICASLPCYRKYALGLDSRAETSPSGKVIILNGYKLTREGDAREVFARELAQAYWFGRGVRCLPRWWEAGLAAWVSGSEAEDKLSAAIQAIREGHVFSPTPESGCILANTVQDDRKLPIFRLQSEMFVGYLHSTNPPAFNATLELLRGKVGLAAAIRESYGHSVESLWGQWLISVAGTRAQSAGHPESKPPPLKASANK